MSTDRNNPASVSDDQTGGEIESLESAEIEAVDLERISGGHASVMIENSAACLTK